jgi:serine/threonine protein kinase
MAAFDSDDTRMQTTHSIKNHTYCQTKALGEGSYGDVLLVFNEEGNNYAMKQFKSEYDKEDLETLKAFLDEDNWEETPENAGPDKVHILPESRGDHDDSSAGIGSSLYSDTETDTDHQTPIPGMETGALREISILRCLSNIQSSDKNYRHPNIISIYDICWFDDTISMVMPKMSMSLEIAVDQNILNNKQKVKITHGLLSAIDFLHVNNVIHRDVKTDNVLLDDDMTAVLCDFSLTKFFTPIVGNNMKGITHTPEVGTSTYRAPEQIWDDYYSFPADIWSAGVVILELFHGMIPEELKEKVALRHIQDLRKKFGKKPLPRLLARLLSQEPKHRPTAQEALKMELFNGYSVPKHQKVLYKQLTPKPKPKGNKKRRNNPAARISRMKKGILEKKPLTEYEKIAKMFEYENPMTCEAAEVYHDKSGEKIIDCMLVASKMYEYFTLDIINDVSVVEGFEIERYLVAEKKILMAMDYCLFI